MAAQKVRESGVDAVGAVPWGTHICLLYETSKDLNRILAPYLKAGLDNNEFCMWITADSLSVEQAAASLRKGMGNVDKCLGKGQLEILNYRQWYSRAGGFEATRVLRGWLRKENQALKRGFHGMRVLGDMAWLDGEYWRAFTRYEAMADQLLRPRRVLAVCAYPLRKASGSRATEVIKNHEVTLVRRGRLWQALRRVGQEGKGLAQSALSDFIAPRTGVPVAGLQAQESRRMMEDRYQWVIDQLPFCLGLSTLSGEVLAVNRAAVALVGYSLEDLKRLGPGILYENPADRKRLIEKVRQEGRAAAFPTRIRRKDGRVLDVLLAAERTRLADVDCFQVMLRDLTGQRQAERALAAAERRVGNLSKQGHDVILILTREGSVLCASATAKRFLGYESDEIPGLKWGALAHATDLRTAWRAFMRLLKSPGESVSALTRFRRKDGTDVRGEWIGTNLLADSEVQAVVIAVREVTERKPGDSERRSYSARPEMQPQALRALAERLMEAEVAERHRLATELHDQLGQRLTALGACLTHVRGKLPPDSSVELSLRLEAALSLVEEIALCTRNLMADLVPPILVDYGLLPTLRWQAMRASSQTGLRIEVQGDEPTPLLGRAKATALCRIAQEAITNIIKHARARQAIVRLEAGPEAVCLRVIDDGVGFDLAVVPTSPTRLSLGLATMRERAAAMGGCLEVQSAPGRGTCIIVWMPR